MGVIKEGSRVWATDDGSTGVVDEIWYEPPEERGKALKPTTMANVVWDRTGCVGQIEVDKLSLIEVKHHVHLTSREEFLALRYPRSVGEVLAEKDSLTVWIVLADKEDHSVRHTAEAVSMSAEYSERHRGWLIQL